MQEVFKEKEFDIRGENKKLPILKIMFTSWGYSYILIEVSRSFTIYECV
jgi:hypothetical protein